jgi:TonB family protein
MAAIVGGTGWEALWLEERDRRWRSPFVVGSILLHLLLVLVLIKGLPTLLGASHREAASPPMTVTLLDPDAVKELPLGPTTHLPSKPKNLIPAPLSRLVPAPTLRPVPSPRTNSAVPEHPPIDDSATLGDPSMLLPPAAGHEPSESAAGEAPSVPPLAGRLPGLPFISHEEINQEVAKLYSDQPKSREPYQANTEDLQYLSYIAQIGRMLELIWKYPREAGDRGQQGQTVIKITILDDGTLEAAELTQSSGYSLLDGEALRVVKRLAPYPPLPKSWHRSQWDLTISFSYILNGVAVNVL